MAAAKGALTARLLAAGWTRDNGPYSGGLPPCLVPAIVVDIHHSGGAMTIRIERQDYTERCEHDNVRRCHAKGPDQFGHFWHVVPMWHAWDDKTNDYAVEPLYRRRDVVSALTAVKKG